MSGTDKVVIGFVVVVLTLLWLVFGGMHHLKVGDVVYNKFTGQRYMVSSLWPMKDVEVMDERGMHAGSFNEDVLMKPEPIKTKENVYGKIKG